MAVPVLCGFDEVDYIAYRTMLRLSAVRTLQTDTEYQLAIYRWRCYPGRVANPRPIAKIKTGRVSQPITDAADATGRDRTWNATRPRSCSSGSERLIGVLLRCRRLIVVNI